MLHRASVYFAGEGGAGVASVGIFFGAMHKGEPVILYEGTAVAEAEDYDFCKTHAGGHFEAWEASRRVLSLHGEYDDFPRGRIVYDQRSDVFNVYLDRALDVPAFRRALMHYFALPEGSVVFRYDAHYARARHKMVFQPDHSQASRADEPRSD